MGGRPAATGPCKHGLSAAGGLLERRLGWFEATSWPPWRLGLHGRRRRRLFDRPLNRRRRQIGHLERRLGQRLERHLGRHDGAAAVAGPRQPASSLSPSAQDRVERHRRIDRRLARVRGYDGDRPGRRGAVEAELLLPATESRGDDLRCVHTDDISQELRQGQGGALREGLAPGHTDANRLLLLDQLPDLADKPDPGGGLLAE